MIQLPYHGQARSNIMGRPGYQPAYERVYEAVRAKIESGEWKPGQQLPPTRELAAMFGVKPTTVKTAMVILSREGWVRGEQGRAIFVADRPGKSGRAKRTT